MGGIIPNMVTEARNSAEVLFTKSQRRILGLLFGSPEHSYHCNEIVRRAGVGIGATLRELERLVASGLVVAGRIGNQKHFQANRDGPVFGELRSIARKLLVEAEAPAPPTSGKSPRRTRSR